MARHLFEQGGVAKDARDGIDELGAVLGPAGGVARAAVGGLDQAADNVAEDGDDGEAGGQGAVVEDVFEVGEALAVDDGVVAGDVELELAVAEGGGLAVEEGAEVADNGVEVEQAFKVDGVVAGLQNDVVQDNEAGSDVARLDVEGGVAEAELERAVVGQEDGALDVLAVLGREEELEALDGQAVKLVEARDGDLLVQDRVRLEDAEGDFGAAAAHVNVDLLLVKEAAEPVGELGAVGDSLLLVGDVEEGLAVEVQGGDVEAQPGREFRGVVLVVEVHGEVVGLGRQRGREGAVEVDL